MAIILYNPYNFSEGKNQLGAQATGRDNSTVPPLAYQFPSKCHTPYFIPNSSNIPNTRLWP